MKPRISMITLGVENIKNSVEFYQRLGFPQFDFSSPNVAFFQLNGTWLCLYGRAALAEEADVSSIGTGFCPISLSHNVESIVEVREAYSLAIEAGAHEVKKPQKAHWGGFHGYFRDPDGFLWEIVHNPYTWVGPTDNP